MNLTTHKLRAAIGLTLAAICAFTPRSTAAGAGHESAVSAPPRPGLTLQRFHSRDEVFRGDDRRLQMSAVATAVVGLESMDSRRADAELHDLRADPPRRAGQPPEIASTTFTCERSSIGVSRAARSRST
jgi:hypothetical protein